jgi:membrane associated rhomboid family serine protease
MMDKEPNNEAGKPSPTSQIGIWIGVGLALGVALGVAMDNIAVGLAIGLLLGAVIGLARSRREKDQKNSIEEKTDEE